MIPAKFMNELYCVGASVLKVVIHDLIRYYLNQSMAEMLPGIPGNLVEDSKILKRSLKGVQAKLPDLIIQ